MQNSWKVLGILIAVALLSWVLDLENWIQEGPNFEAVVIALLVMVLMGLLHIIGRLEGVERRGTED